MLSRPTTVIHDRRRRRETAVRIRIGYVFTWLPRPVVLVLAALAPVAAGVVLFLVVSTDPTYDPKHDALTLVGASALITGLTVAAWPRSKRWIEIGPGGMRYATYDQHSSEPAWQVATIALNGIAGFEVRQSIPTLNERVGGAQRPGTHVWVVFRRGAARPLLKMRRPPRVDLRISRRGLQFRDAWEPVRAPDGAALRWREDNAHDVVYVLWDAFRASVAQRNAEHAEPIDLDAPLEPRVDARPVHLIPQLGTEDLNGRAALTPPQGRWEQYAVHFDGPSAIADRRDAATPRP